MPVERNIYRFGVLSSWPCVGPALVQANWGPVPQVADWWLGIGYTQEVVLVILSRVYTNICSILDFGCWY